MQIEMQHSHSRRSGNGFRNQTKDGNKYKLSDFGFRVKDIVIESPEIEDNYETKENTSGRMLLSSQYRKEKLRYPAM